ncbi:hypothetical protein V8E55_004987 [Tylopilus felleus]
MVNTDKGAQRIIIDCRDDIYSLALADGKHFLSGGKEGKIRSWRIQDGNEVGMPMDAGSIVCGIAVSRDGKWIVSGTKDGLVIVWNAESHEKVTEIKRHTRWVGAVDVSPNGTKIASGSDDETACVWSLSTGQRLLGPLGHHGWVVGAKFSPDGCLIATATRYYHSVRVYDNQNGHLLVDVPIQVNSSFNRSLVWAIDGKQLFALSRDGNIHCLDPFHGTTLSKWPIHSSKDVTCIALEGTGTLIAASAGSSVSFWGTTTRKQIGAVIEHNHRIWSIAISDTNDLAVCGNNSISLTPFSDILLQANPVLCFKTVQELRTDLINFQCRANQQHDNLCEQGPNLDENAQQHRFQLSDSQCTTNKKEDSIDECISSLRAVLRARDEYSDRKIAYREQTIQELRVRLVQAEQKADLTNRTHEQRHQCESLYYQGRIYDAAQTLLAASNDVRGNTLIADWLVEFTHRCITALERVGDEASNASKQEEALAAYFAALSLSSSSMTNTVLTKWARMMLLRGSANDALCATSKFKVTKFLVHRVICDILEDDGRLTEAFYSFQKMRDELLENTDAYKERAQWELEFRKRCIKRLVKLRNTAMDAKKHDEAIGHYSDAQTLDPMHLNEILLKYSNEVIELDPSSHTGYEGKHAALHGMKQYSEAFKAFRMMLSRLEQSPDPQVRELRCQYVDATSEVQKVVEKTIRHMPRVLIDTDTGRLYDKTQQAAAFEELPMYNVLRSSMIQIAQLDRARIQREVKAFYRYVMLSHKWQSHEATFQTVENISVYDLPASPTFSKLRNFCKLVEALQFKWAWSDTCCVNQLDKGVLQESLVAMFSWYRGSSLTVVHLLGVFSESQEEGCLWRSIWNTRGWTYQEYLASNVVQFFTEDWKPYLGLNIFNHKESPIILSEMERAMKFAAQELATLQPGLDRAREKLYLASRRETTREEDMAYSLFGIFNVALPVIYGEGNQAVGRLLEHVLPRSDNVTLLAWTGSSGSHHSYLPSDLTVYNEIVPPHVPALIETAKMDGLVTSLRSSLPDPLLAVAIYEQFYKLPPLSLIAGRLQLPGIVFPLDDLVLVPESDPDSDLLVYRTTSPMIGDVEIKTREELTGLKDGLLIHPWISPLLDRDFSRGKPLFNLTTRALRLVVRLRQPFGALLLAPLGRTQYRRIATDSLIMVQLREETSLGDLIGIRTVDIQ